MWRVKELGRSLEEPLRPDPQRRKQPNLVL
jgi:hypothetical protein